MSRILIVEDEPDLAFSLQEDLRRQGHETTHAPDGATALELGRDPSWDLILLAVMLPKMDGFDVCSALRKAGVSTPIIMLTARAHEAEKELGLDSGADDYVTKPFSPKELIARVTARLRRNPAAGAAPDTALVRYRSITIDADRHRVTSGGEDIRLTAKEFLLLQYLIRHRGRVLSRDVLLTDVWGYQYTGGTRTVDVHIRRLREKLPVLNDAIETVKQFGYRLA